METTASNDCQLEINFSRQTTKSLMKYNYQLLDVVEKNIVICQWLEDKLFVDAEDNYLKVN